MLGLNKVKNRNQMSVLSICLVYFFFSCFYVLSCQRNLGRVLLFSDANPVSHQQYLGKTHHAAIPLKFLSRPRVITNRITSVFSVAVCCTLIYFLFAGILLPPVRRFSPVNFYYHTPSIRLLRTWRI